MRTVRPLDLVVGECHPDNTVTNTRYTVLTFLFVNLFEQFSRPLNFYFLLVACLQFISIIAPVNPLSTLLPLVFAFSLTAAKEGYDDFKRGKQDRVYNHTKRTVFTPDVGWVQKRNCDIRVGDVILVRQDEEVPCDVVVLAASSGNSVFIRTDNLDGEIDLKQRDVVAYHVGSETAHPTVPGRALEDGSLMSPKGLCGGIKQLSVRSFGSFPEAAALPFPSTSSRSSRCDGDDSLPICFHDDDQQLFQRKLARITLVCPPPSSMLESFDGRAQFTQRGVAPPALIPISHHHLLPQSCYLKNTTAAVCLAVYTGSETKCGMNRRPVQVKWAKVDQDVSKYAVLIFICQLISALLFGLVGFFSNQHIDKKFWYLPTSAAEATAPFLIYTLRFFLLTTVMIPVSFKLVVDMSKYYMAMSVEWDVAMFDDTTKEGCKVKNSSILEDLGQIDYVLSDKTGTMTQNVMVLQYVVAGDTEVNLALPPSGSPTSSYADTPSGTPAAAVASTAMGESPSRRLVRGSSEVTHFFVALALCNAVEVCSEATGGGGANCRGAPTYQSASPDEEALCNGAAQVGVCLLDRHSSGVVLGVHGEEQQWLTHHVFSFSSEKKSMSVVVEHHATGRLLLITKGADDKVFSMSTLAEFAKQSSKTCAQNGADREGAPTDAAALKYSHLQAHLNRYAGRGLRTLLVGQRELTHAEVDEMRSDLRRAELSMERLAELVDHIRQRLETNLDIIGVTAIEDKLQDGVAETVNDFLHAGVRVWMLTGDKVETAEQIGLACALYAPGDRVVRVVDDPSGQLRWEEELRNNALSLPAMEDSAAGAGAVAAATTQRIGTSVIQRVLNFHPRAPGSSTGGAGFATGNKLASDVCVESPVTAHTDDVKDTSPPAVSYYNSIDPPLAFHSSVQADRVGRGTSAEPSMLSATRASNAAAGDVALSGRHPGFHLDSVAVPMLPDGVAPGSRVETVLVIQGGYVLERILSSPTLSEHLAVLASRCASVICARVTPSQKAAITDFVRRRGFMTLAVGDGGNDVAMLQEAHVGIGITGKEGKQAARAADFAISRFSHLRSLVFVHGQQGYCRTAYVIKYSFYKSMLISFIQLAFNITSTYYSGGTFWNSYSLVMWNGAFTLPQTFFYCLDRVAPRVVLERNPFLYKLTRKGADMSVAEFFIGYIMRGVLQSVMVLWLTLGVYGITFSRDSNGHTASKDEVFTVAYTALMISQVVTVLLESHSVTSINAFWIFGMPVLYVAVTLAYSSVPKLDYYGVMLRTLTVEGLLSAMGIAAALVLPFFILNTLVTILWPNSRDVLRHAEVMRQRRLLRSGGWSPRKSGVWATVVRAMRRGYGMLCIPEEESVWAPYHVNPMRHSPCGASMRVPDDLL